MGRIHLFALICLLLSSQLHGASVWKVSKGNDYLYVGGTIHVLSQSDYPLPEQYDTAYTDSDTLVFETDIAAVESPAFQQQAMSKMMLTGGSTIKDFISDETFTLLENHLQTRGIPVANFLPFNPGFLSITLSMIELQIMGINSAGVDSYYAVKGTGDGKKTLWFEAPMEQLEMLANLGKGNEDNMIRYTLEDLKRMPEAIPKLMDAWRKGDMTALDKNGNEDMRNQFPNIYRDLVVQRNKNWVPQVEKLFNNEQREFILVGTLHLAGPDSVLAMLEDKGYQIEKL